MAIGTDEDARFDYVVVGAGTAGCLLADRLSATGASVCVLEAGGRDWSPLIHLPVGYVWNVHSRRLTWDYAVEPGPVVNRRFRLPQGKVLGGSSSINGLSHVRGQRQDYDDWAAAGNPGWSYLEILPYFMRSERKIGVGDDRFRGRSGSLHITDQDWSHPICDAFVNGLSELGIPLTEDYNGMVHTGGGYLQRAIHKGRRCSSARAFLKPAMQRPNVEVRTRAHVSRILFEGNRAVGVRCVRGGPRGREQTIRVNREVILAAGAVSTPKLLQISGVGDRALIESLGVPLVADLPGVGQNLQDHYRVRLVSRLRYVVSINEVVLSPRLISEFVKWMRGRPNVLSLSASMAYTYWRSRPDVERPDLEFVFAPASFRGGVVGLLDGWPGMTLGIWQGRPESRGSVQARTASPFDAPRIQPNYLTDERDQRVLIDGIRLGRKMMSTSTLAPFVAQEEVPGDKYQTDEELLDFARETGATVYHVVGTCRMGPAYRRDSVVDHQLCVHGLQGLRVVDASIMPRLPSVNTNASTLMIAEKASDMILGLPPLHPADNLPGEDESLLGNA